MGVENQNASTTTCDEVARARHRVSSSAALLVRNSVTLTHAILLSTLSSLKAGRKFSSDGQPDFGSSPFSAFERGQLLPSLPLPFLAPDHHTIFPSTLQLSHDLLCSQELQRCCLLRLSSDLPQSFLRSYSRLPRLSRRRGIYGSRSRMWTVSSTSHFHLRLIHPYLEPMLTCDLLLFRSNERCRGLIASKLTSHFTFVLGVDPGESMISVAQSASSDLPESKLRYKVGKGEDLSFVEDSSVDLVTVGQAAHCSSSLLFISPTSPSSLSS